MSDADRLERHLINLIGVEIDRGSTPADVVTALLGAAGETLRRAGHTNVDNIAGELGAVVARRVRREAQP